jgi:hypothetical protein
MSRDDDIPDRRDLWFLRWAKAPKDDTAFAVLRCTQCHSICIVREHSEPAARCAMCHGTGNPDLNLFGKARTAGRA